MCCVCCFGSYWGVFKYGYDDLLQRGFAWWGLLYVGGLIYVGFCFCVVCCGG